MTIEAKIATSPTGGHGLTPELLEAMWAELIKGKQVGLVPALVMLQPKTINGDVIKKTGKRAIQFQIVRLEPVTDPTDASAVQLRISESYQSRHDNGQDGLDLGEEDARRYLAYIDEWRKESKLTVKQVGELWRENFPPDSGVPGDYKRAGSQPLHEFVLKMGILPDEFPGAPTDQPTEGETDAPRP